MNRMLLCALLVVLLPAGLFASPGTDQPLSKLNPQKVATALDSLSSVMQLRSIYGAAPIFSIHGDLIRLQNRVLEKYDGVGNIKAVGQLETLKKTGLAPLNWQLSASMNEVPYYILSTAFDLGGYPNNNPPYTPSNPNPPNGATNVEYDVTLTWVGGDPDAEDIVTYDVYFGTQTNPPLVASNQSATSYAVSNLASGTIYYWKIISKDNFGGVTEGPVWQFTTKANNPPYEPVNPIPPNGATDVDINANLSWQCNDPDPGDSLRYDVYLGTTSNPPRVAQNITTIPFEPGVLNTGTTYYWKIVARDNAGAETSGAVWSFTTSTTSTNHPPNIPTNPNPPNGATGVWINEDISWTGGDPDTGDTVVYDIYFGTTTPPPILTQSYTGTSYDVGTMTQSTTYYWKIVARDNHQAESQSSVWSFTTGTATDPTPTPTPPVDPCTEYAVKLDMGGTNFCAGDICYLTAKVCNPEGDQYMPLFIILDIEGSYWFAPSWRDSLDYYFEVVSHDWSTVTVIEAFEWPSVEGSYSNAVFWGALTDTGITMIMGDYDMYTFGWGSSCP